MSSITPSQTVGPFFAYGLTPRQYGYDFVQSVGADLRGQGAGLTGDPITLVGRVFDGDGEVVPDAMIEIWQADGGGRYPGPAAAGANAPVVGLGRCGTGTDPGSCYRFETVKPGATGPEQAPHINVTVFARGVLTHLVTRIYFADESEANARDPVLASVPEDRRDTLLAQPQEDGSEAMVYRFDIVLQGENETVFLGL